MNYVKGEGGSDFIIEKDVWEILGLYFQRKISGSLYKKFYTSGGLFFRWILLNLTISNILVTFFRTNPNKSVKRWKERSECETVKFSSAFHKKSNGYRRFKSVFERDVGAFIQIFLVNTTPSRVSNERLLKLIFLIRLITLLSFEYFNLECLSVLQNDIFSSIRLFVIASVFEVKSVR